MATAGEGGKGPGAAAPPPQLESFLAIGLDQRTAENALANRKVTANLTAVIAEVCVIRFSSPLPASIGADERNFITSVASGVESQF
jgi:hypothetical protein